MQSTQTQDLQGGTEGPEGGNEGPQPRYRRPSLPARMTLT